MLLNLWKTDALFQGHQDIQWQFLEILHFTCKYYTRRDIESSTTCDIFLLVQ